MTLQFTKHVVTKTPEPVLDEIRRIDLAARVTGTYPYVTNIQEWLQPVVDLTRFHVYPMNGITEGLDYWASVESRRIGKRPGDYEWVTGHTNNIQVLYLSNPSSIHGNRTTIPVDVPVALDLAYVGSTELGDSMKLPDNVERVFYSLSKSFGLKNVRTGWMLTRRPDPRLEALCRQAFYYNYLANAIAERVIEKFPPNYTHGYYRDQQAEVCERYGFTPCDSVWLATTSDPAYIEYRRPGSDLARVCITGEYR